PLDPVFREHPHVYLDRLREEAPVLRDTALNRLFLTRFEDVRAVLGNRALAVDPRKASPDSYHRRVVLGDHDPAMFEPSMLHMDDPDHKRIRGLVSQAFNQRAVEAFRPRIQEIADQLLDAVADRDGFDVIADYAAPLPTIVIAEMLGVDPRDQARFKKWSDALAHVFNPRRTPEQEAELVEADEGLIDYFQQIVDARRKQRGTDLVSALVSAEEAGDRLTEREIISTCNLLLVAGNVTTTDLIGNAVLALLRHPEELAKLRARPELIRNAVEEMLRYDPPVSQGGRLALEPMEVGGVKVPAGASLSLSLMAAGHDPAVHRDPHRFDIERADTSHLAFGGGAHFCLGAPLARAEAQIAIATLLRRFPHLALDPSVTVEHKRIPVFNGVAMLRVRTR
ncbi:MAG TPA: cytochrome P450, partial [Acetobacteraceae bacterium]|nr:cytochrome P450 [Acetobacteraceae bacterium]